MAAGDRINIADKETLDAVKSSVDRSLGDTEEILRRLEALESNGTPTVVKDASKLVIYSDTYPGNPNTVAHQVVGSGTLYLALATNIIGVPSAGQLRINIDGRNILVRSIYAASGNSGDSSGFAVTDYASAGYGTGYGNTIRVKTNNHILTGSTMSSIRGFSDTSNGITLSPIPLRFNSFFSITLVDTSAVSTVSCIYILD